MARPFSDIIDLRRLSELSFESLRLPEGMGTVVTWAFGGAALAVGLKAAYQTVPNDYHLYSATGSYLGPASTQHPLKIVIEKVRDTKAFATRHITVSQQMKPDSSRNVVVMLLDFQLQERHTLLQYSAPPRLKYERPEQSHTTNELCERLFQQGKISSEQADLGRASFPLVDEYFEQRHCPSGVFAQNLSGVAKKLPTTQDQLPLHSKATAAWFKSKRPLESSSDHVCAAIWLMDSALAYTPLSFNQQFFDDVQAVASLDFAFRMLVNDIDINEWSLREMTTIAGGIGRTYSEARLWDDQGRMTCVMSQQCILRPKPPQLKSSI